MGNGKWRSKWSTFFTLSKLRSWTSITSLVIKCCNILPKLRKISTGCRQNNLGTITVTLRYLMMFYASSIYSLCLNFFHLLARKPNLENFSIYSNKFFHNCHLSKSSFTCPWLRASGLARRLNIHQQVKCHKCNTWSC
jgi:hypothetical protein